ncbi:MAG: ABC transporter substrate-binding protein [Actinomycetota bacterium]
MTLIGALALLAAACSSERPGGEAAAESASEASASEPSESASADEASGGEDSADDADDAASEPEPDVDQEEDGADEAAADEDAAAEPEPTEEPTPEPAPTEEPSIYPITISDSYGNEFTFDERPRIGCAWYGCIEAGAELGVTFEAAIITEEEADSTFFGALQPDVLIVDFLNPEEWAAADVDLVVLSPASNTPELDPIRQVNPLFYLHYDNFLAPQWEGVIGGYEGYLENLRLLGQLMDRTAEAEEAIARFDRLVESLATYATPEMADQTIAIIGLLGYAALGPGNAFCQILNEAGHGTCIGEGVAQILNAEAFLALDPDVILDQDPAARDGDPIWPNLSAVQDGTVYDIVSNRHYCCSTSGLVHVTQEYLSLRFPDAGVEDPGPVEDFDSRLSPLVTEG